MHCQDVNHLWTCLIYIDHGEATWLHNFLPHPYCMEAYSCNHNWIGETGEHKINHGWSWLLLKITLTFSQSVMNMKSYQWLSSICVNNEYIHFHSKHQSFFAWFPDAKQAHKCYQFDIPICLQCLQGITRTNSILTLISI